MQYLFVAYRGFPKDNFFFQYVKNSKNKKWKSEYYAEMNLW